MTQPKLPTDENRAAACFLANRCPLESNLGLQLQRITGQLTLALDRELTPLGVTNAQCAALMQIRWGGCASVAELAKACGTDAGGMTRILDRLESKELLVRTRDGEDRRVVGLTLTHEGNRLSETAPATYARVMNFVLSGFSLAEHEALETLLRRMLKNRTMA